MCPKLSLITMSFSPSHTHLFPLGSSCFVFIFPPFQFLTFAFAGRRRHSLRSRCACRISITLSGPADTHLPADESRKPAGEVGWKVRVQQLWIIDTGQDGEFSGQSCQLMYGYIGMWRQPTGARCRVQVHIRCTSGAQFAVFVFRLNVFLK